MNYRLGISAQEELMFRSTFNTNFVREVRIQPGETWGERCRGVGMVWAGCWYVWVCVCAYVCACDNILW